MTRPQLGEGGRKQGCCVHEVGSNWRVPRHDSVSLGVTPRSGADSRTLEERLAKRQKYTPVRVDRPADLDRVIPHPEAGWVTEKREPVTEPAEPRRSTRARAERTYRDGDDDEGFEVTSDEEPSLLPALGAAQLSAPQATVGMVPAAAATPTLDAMEL